VTSRGKTIDRRVPEGHSAVYCSSAEDEGENVLRSIRSRGKRKLVTVVDAEFERAVLVTVLGDWSSIMKHVSPVLAIFVAFETLGCEF
jgi:hypothetical protein